METRPALLIVLALIAALAHPAARPQSFSADLSDVSSWHTNDDTSVVARAAKPGHDIDWGLQWTLPPIQNKIYYVQRRLPICASDLHTIQFDVFSSDATAVEVQLATERNARLYHIARLPESGWHHVSVNVWQMGRHQEFRPQDFQQNLLLRFWVDGNPDWASGAVPRDKELRLVFANISLAPTAGDLPRGIDAKLTIAPDTITGTIHPHVYGHFLEHIYHSVTDGLYAELVRNRAFVGPHGFYMQGDKLIQEALGTDTKIFTGDPTWRDYQFTLKARKTGGNEGFLIIFRAEDQRNFYWWNLGGWGNEYHQLEVETDDQRHPIGERIDGRIETDHWYDIRVRAEGDHLQGWLDGEKLLDIHDDTHLQGSVGLGTWSTRAEYKDMRVTDLGGNPLPLDFAAHVQPVSLPTHWHPVPAEDNVNVSLARLPDSPNTGLGVRIRLDANQSRGIRQERFNIVQGHTCRGRAWFQVSGHCDAVTMAFVGSDGEQLAADSVTPSPMDTAHGWQHCEFTLDPTSSDPDGALTLTARGDGHLLIDVVSLMRDDSLQTACRADLLGAIEALQPPIIRWPGGCFASIYRWKRSIGPTNHRKPFYNSPWGQWDSAGFGTDEFMKLCSAVGAEPLIVLNLGSWDDPEKADEYLQDALDWIEYCNGDTSTPMGKLRARNGHPEPYNVKHWELDNETWGMGVEAYAQRVIRFATEINERWPDLTLYACSHWQEGDPQLLEAAGDHFDLLSYHLYVNPDDFGGAPRRFERIWSDYERIVAKAGHPDMKLAITEWNAQSTDWRTGLFAGALLNVMERSDIVQMASPALFLRRVDAPSWDNAFINHNYRGWFPAPNYVVMKLYRQHYQPNRVQLENLGPLNAVATLSDDRGTLVLKVVNPLDRELACAIDITEEFTVGEANQWTIAADLDERNTLDDPHHIAPSQTALRETGNNLKHKFAPHSVTVFEFHRQR